MINQSEKIMNETKESFDMLLIFKLLLSLRAISDINKHIVEGLDLAEDLTKTIKKLKHQNETPDVITELKEKRLDHLDRLLLLKEELEWESEEL